MSPRITVRVPATSANLGPGFDCAGLALGLYDEVVVEATAAGVRVEIDGEGADDLPRDESHLVVATALATVRQLGGTVPGLHLRARNAIPHGRGLGSSAAAVVAGVLVGHALASGGRPATDDLLAAAAAAEGHPDNVAACVLGGFTLAWAESTGRYRAVRLPVHPRVRPVLFVPPGRLATVTARGLLPATVPHADAAANAGRAALLTHALTAAPELLLAATSDRLHQDHREPAMPDSLALVRRLRSDGVPAVISGAGPAVLALVALTDANETDADETGADPAGRAPPGWRVWSLPVDTAGAQVMVDG